MHCVEMTEEIGKHFNLTLLTYKNILSALYAKLSMNLSPSESCHIDPR